MISRCVGKQFLLGGRAERSKYLELLGRAAAKTDAIVLAYCVMSSHVHLVVRAGTDPLWRLMKSVNSGFAVWLNRRSGGQRDGAVFSNRYKAILVEEESYLLQLVRYVHNNPVRARVASDASNSKWTSHRAYLGMDECPEWLNIGYVLSTVNPKIGWARRQFAKFVDEGKSEKRRRDLCGEEHSSTVKQFQKSYGDAWRISGPLLGSAQFAACVLEDIAKIDEQQANAVLKQSVQKQARPTLDELIAVACAHVGTEPWEFEYQPGRRSSALARRLIVFLWVSDFGGSQAEVARKLNATSPAVSQWYSRAVTQLPDLSPDLDAVRGQFPSYLQGANPSVRTRVILDFDS